MHAATTKQRCCLHSQSFTIHSQFIHNSFTIHSQFIHNHQCLLVRRDPELLQGVLSDAEDDELLELVEVSD
jgi:hypothetical protein